MDKWIIGSVTGVSDPRLKNWRILVLRTSPYTMQASSLVIDTHTT